MATGACGIGIGHVNRSGGLALHGEMRNGAQAFGVGADGAIHIIALERQHDRRVLWRARRAPPGGIRDHFR